MRIAKGLVVLTSLTLLAGCASKEKAHTYVTPEGQVVSTTRPASDAALESQLRSELNQYGELAADSANVRISAQNGNVTLNGSVPNEKDKQMIDAMARNAAGVASVNNQLQVTYTPTGAVTQPTGTVAAPGPRIEAATDQDQRIGNNLLEQFHSDSIPPSQLQNVTISVNNGDVALRGLVQDREERRSIVSSAQRTPGVRRVESYLQTE